MLTGDGNLKDASKKWLTRIIVVVILVPGVPYVAGSIAIVGYTWWPRDLTDVSRVEPSADTDHVVVLAHGAKDTPATWADPLRRTLERRRTGTEVVSLDWSEYASSAFRCSVDGRRIGREVGQRLAASPGLKSVHLVGHSCGSFVVVGICEALRESGRTVAVQTTFLDPVTIYGGLFWDYGLDSFGRCGDFSDAYIDTEDGVPGSNERLPHAHTFDVTEARKEAGYTGSPHLWPTAYYLRLAAVGRALELRQDATLESRFPRGVLQPASLTGPGSR